MRIPAPNPLNLDLLEDPLAWHPEPTPTQGEVEAKLQDLYLAFGGYGTPHLAMWPGKPTAKARPRHAHNGNTYQDPADRAKEQATLFQLRRRYRGMAMVNVCLVAAFLMPDRNTADWDNQMKHLQDAMNKVLMKDDRQITGGGAFQELDRENPRTVVLFGPHRSSLDRRVAPSRSARRKTP